MFNLVEKRRWYFILSAMVIIPGLIIMGYSWGTTGAPFRLSIDFLGGSIYTLTFVGDDVTEDGIRTVFESTGDENPVIQQLGVEETRWLLVNPTTDAGDVDATITALSETWSSSGQEGTAVISQTDGLGYLMAFSDEAITEETVRTTFADFLGDGATLSAETATTWSVRASFKETEEERQQLEADLEAQIAPIDRDSFSLEAVSATVGREVTRSAFFAVLAGAAVITGFIMIAFRQVPNAFRYGVCAILAMVHDILIVMGVMSLMGLLFNWEVDALFLTAVLTVVGFSVQDSIVVFDRIRENIPIRLGEPYETIVNRSLWETIHRSLATQLNAFFIMIALLLFGGETVQHFIFILFIGLLSGSYSSLFTAVPLLVAWEKGEIPFLNQENEFQTADAVA
ncbi:MAG: protein translocase subunit SecF [Chloroflexota bacterium]